MDEDVSTDLRTAALLNRSRVVIPGGMYGHQNASTLPAPFPQFMERGMGARVWDVDGHEYVDLMCSYGPVVLGHHHPAVERAASAQALLADCQNGPSERMVEMAEAMVGAVEHADWAMFQKNGTDATTLSCTIARATTGRRRILMARGAYHGAAPWCTPRPGGVTPEDRLNLGYFTYNDLESVRTAVAASGDDLAGIIVSPFRHDAGLDQELVDVDFARGLRAICDETGAALILDDVRCGFRLHVGSSWELIHVMPDLSAWSKAIANGYALAAVLGSERFREGATTVYTTGSFWFSAVAMAAGVATIQALTDDDAIGRMIRMGDGLRSGIAEQADAFGIAIKQTGPVQMPYLTFDDDGPGVYELANRFTSVALRHGLFIHPRHNWFVSAAMSDDDLERALDATQAAFSEVWSYQRNDRESRET